MKKKKIKNGQLQTKFTGSCKKKSVKEIWNYKEKDLENFKSYMLDPFEPLGKFNCKRAYFIIFFCRFVKNTIQ